MALLHRHAKINNPGFYRQGTGKASCALVGTAGKITTNGEAREIAFDLDFLGSSKGISAKAKGCHVILRQNGRIIMKSTNRVELKAAVR